MKKRTPIALGLVLTSLLSLTACGGKDMKTANNGTNNGVSQEMEVTEEMKKATFLASESSLPYQDEYDFPGLGMKMTLDPSLEKPIKEKRLGLFPEDLPNPDNDKVLDYAQLTFKEMDEKQRTAQVHKIGDDYQKWYEGLKPVATLGLYNKSLEKDLDEITKCDNHKVLGESSDHQYKYILSTSSKADPSLTEAILKTKVAYQDMIPYDGQSAFFVQKPMSNASNIGPFKTVDINNKPYTADDLAKNKLTMVNVFATWCGPCIQEIPELAKLQKDYASKGFGIIGVVTDASQGSSTRDESVEKAKIIQEKTKASYPFIAPDKTNFNGRLDGIAGLPFTFFVNAKGDVVGDAYSGARSYKDWKAIVDKELAKVN